MDILINRESFIVDIFQFVMLFAIVSPLILSGCFILLRYTDIKRIEVLAPLSFVVGVSIYIFAVNMISHFLHPKTASVTAFVILIVGSLFLNPQKYFKKISFPKLKEFIFIFVIFTGWHIYLFWKVGHPNFGGDNMIYYGIGSSIMRGNYPPVSPWQPDLSVKYHTGFNFLLGIMREFSGLRYEYIHIWIDLTFGISFAMLLAFVWTRPKTYLEFFSSCIISLIGLVNYGGLIVAFPSMLSKLALPKLDLPNFLFWIYRMPKFNSLINTYGGGVAHIDAFFYFSFRLIAITLLFSIFVIQANTKKLSNILFISGLLLTSLALFDETIFIAGAPVVFILTLYTYIRKFHPSRIFKALTFWIVIVGTLTIFQGGVITDSVFDNSDKSSIVFFPSTNDREIQLRQTFIDKLMWKYISPSQSNTFFHWFFPGLIIMLSVVIVLILLRRKSGEVDRDVKQSNKIAIGLFASSVIAVIAFRGIIPRYTTENSIRFLTTAYQLLGISLTWMIFNFLKHHKNKKILYVVATLFVFIPSVLPPLAASYRENKIGKNIFLSNARESRTRIQQFILQNTKYGDRLLSLDREAPSPVASVSLMVSTGALVPLFGKDYRAYNLDVGPEFYDIASTLSPQALKKLGVNYLLIDNIYYENLPQIRKTQLFTNEYFSEIFLNSENESSWKRLFRVNTAYLSEAEELPGTLNELSKLIPNGVVVYLDKHENFPAFARSPIALTLKDRDLHFIWGPGLYLNLETSISHNEIVDAIEYNYLILGSSTDPDTITDMLSDKIWNSSDGKIILWKMRK